MTELRVEGPNRTLDPGTFYATGTERIRRSRQSDACNRGKGKLTIPGRNALGLVQSGADRRKALRQVRVRRDEAGFFVCEIGSIVGRPFSSPQGFAGWSYYLNFSFGSRPADEVAVGRGDSVLWVFSDFNEDPAKQRNTGMALELRGVEPGTTDGQMTVRVVAHQFDGSTTPVSDAEIEGASFQAPGESEGEYEITVPPGFTTLTATRAKDIPSNHERTCFRPSASECPSAHGRTIYASGSADRFAGTRGWDRIRALSGADRVDASQGGEDLVDCGAGRDTVLLGRAGGDDQIRGCERILRARD
ncbi:MAG: hypothetical protein H0W09_01775 [Solirubrobacterales bacterium]|nr:hypothetical protein [Solirubrobacterales bacterium]